MRATATATSLSVRVGLLGRRRNAYIARIQSPLRRYTTAAEHRIDGQGKKKHNSDDNDIMTSAVARWYHRRHTWEATCDMLVALAYRRG